MLEYVESTYWLGSRIQDPLSFFPSRIHSTCISQRQQKSTNSFFRWPDYCIDDLAEPSLCNGGHDLGLWSNWQMVESRKTQKMGSVSKDGGQNCILTDTGPNFQPVCPFISLAPLRLSAPSLRLSSPSVSARSLTAGTNGYVVAVCVSWRAWTSDLFSRLGEKSSVPIIASPGRPLEVWSANTNTIAAPWCSARPPAFPPLVVPAPSPINILPLLPGSSLPIRLGSVYHVSLIFMSFVCFLLQCDIESGDEKVSAASFFFLFFSSPSSRVSGLS